MIGHRGRNSAGFTLLELMIVVGIVAILAALAISGYGYAMVKSRRAAAEGCLQESAQFMERFYTTNLAYDKTPPPDEEDVPEPKCSQDVTPYYDVRLVPADLSATEYTLEAVPTGKQNDSRCGTLTINYKGIKTASGTGGVSACW
jgi:type IV pilus assembly protein PilE